MALPDGLLSIKTASQRSHNSHSQPGFTACKSCGSSITHSTRSQPSSVWLRARWRRFGCCSLLLSETNTFSIRLGRKPCTIASSIGNHCGNQRFALHGRQHICAIRCVFAANRVSGWPFAMCSFLEQVLADVSRIRTTGGVYRNVYPHRSGEWDDLVAAATDDGAMWLVYGLLCQYVASLVSPNGEICYARFACCQASIRFVYDCNRVAGRRMCYDCDALRLA